MDQLNEKYEQVCKQLKIEQVRNLNMQQNQRKSEFESHKLATKLRIQLAQMKRIFDIEYHVETFGSIEGDQILDESVEENQFDVIDQLKEAIKMEKATIKQLKLEATQQHQVIMHLENVN